MAKRGTLIIAIASLALALIVAGVLLERRSRPGAAVPAYVKGEAAPGRTRQPRIPDPPPLPDNLQQPGLATKKLGPMRVYLTVQSEVSLRDNNGRSIERLPILIVLENDTYEKQSWPPQISKPDELLFSLSVSKAASQFPKPVFTHNEPAGEQKAWEPAERRAFTIPWHVRDAHVGDTYVINLSIHGGGALELRARII